MSNLSMKNLEKANLEKVNDTSKMMERAKQIEQEITEVKETLKGLPGGLDQEILQQIEAATEAAKDEAGKDGDALEKAQEKTNGEFKKICALLEKKLIENDKAAAELKGIRSDYGKKSIDRVLDEISKNSELGRSVSQKSQETMTESQRKIEEMRKIIEF